jgi:hypothetical protein
MLLLKRASAVLVLLATLPHIALGQKLPDPAPLDFEQQRLAPRTVLPDPVDQLASAVAPVDHLSQAVREFNSARNQKGGSYREASKLFAAANINRATLSDEHHAAWAYCRLCVAAERLNETTDAATSQAMLDEIDDALAKVPGHAKLQAAAKPIRAVAQARVGGTRNVPTKRSLAAVQPVESGWALYETDNFCVKHTQGQATLAKELAELAEDLRVRVCKKWSGPPGGHWAKKCTIILHATADDFSTATQQPKAATGRAMTQHQSGQVTSRQIDLRADDDTLQSAALPRELTHILLADLFPQEQPPAWAGLGIAVLSTAETEVERYLKTLSTCAKRDELMPLDRLMSAAEVPTDNVTGFHVESVALVEYLVRTKGEKAFFAFLRDAQRYGQLAAMKRAYGFASVRALEDAFLRDDTQAHRD